MKNFRLYFAAVLVGLALLPAAVLLAARTSRGQSKNAAKPIAGDSGVKRILKTSGLPASPAGRNALLATELNWTFGAKPQRGWYLYKPLIGRLLETGHEATSPG